MSQETIAKLFYANPEINADLLYFGKFMAPDPFLALGIGSRKIAVLSDLELGRGRKESNFDEILSLSEVREAAARRYRTGNATLLHCIRHLAKEYRIDRFRVPSDFPASLAFRIKAARLPLEVVENSFLPAREAKSNEEAAFIREGNRASALGFEIVREILKKAKETRRGTLNWKNRPLTSERIQKEIEKALLDRGARSTHTIVAGGDQACDPHERGHGVLRANELIIVDIFPRMLKSGYHGDMTRTFLKGRASEAQKKLVSTVKTAHEAALNAARSGVSGSSIHREVTDLFLKAGYKTRKTKSGFEGFFHGTGHGLGLDVHEPPRVSPGAPRLKKAAVVTIEPGLYYPGLGGCRIEDVVRLNPQGNELLSKAPYSWVIP